MSIKSSLTLSLASALSILPICANAQSAGQDPTEETVSIKIVEYRDSTDTYITLHENAPKLQGTPDVPRFTLHGKEGKFYMGLGANIKSVALFDFGHPIHDDNMFTTSAIPIEQQPGNGAQFRFSAQQSNIYLNVVALPGTKNQLGAYISINFLGNGYTPQLQVAYLKYRGITAGYNYSLFTDVGAVPTTIDYEGPNAFACMIHGNIYYEHPFGKNKEWKAGIGIDMPSYSATNASQTATVTQRVPDIPFYLQRSWANGNGWLRLSGIIRNLYYRDNSASRNIDKVGWGIKASGKTPIARGLSAYYQGVYGKGVTSYIQDLGGTGMDLMPDPENPGALNRVEAWGAYGALQYNFSPNVFCTAMYSHVRTYANQYADSSTPWKNGYKYAQYVVGNVFWKVNSIVEVGLEYLYGRRVDFDNRQAHDNRIQTLLQVSF